MKRVMIALAAAIVMCTAAFAQDNKNPEQRPERKFDKKEMVKKRTDDAVKKYGLDDKQAQQLLDLNTKYADKMGGRGFGGPRGPRHDGKPGKGGKGDAKEGRPEPPRDGKRPEMTQEQKEKMEAMRKEHHEAMKAYDAELEKILTPDQFKKYKEDMKKRGPRGGHHGPHQQK